MAAARHGDPSRNRRGETGRRPDGRRTVRPGFAHEKALIFGVIQLLAGVAAVILGVISIATKSWGYYYGSGFWGGIFFAASGVFGLAAARRKNNCTIVTFMTLSAISAMLALVMMALGAIGVASDNMLFQEHHITEGSALVVHSLLIVVAVVESLCATASSIVGCRAVCGVWYHPDNPYFSADLQTPSVDFTAFRQNSNLQYLVDPDLHRPCGSTEQAAIPTGPSLLSSIAPESRPNVGPMGSNTPVFEFQTPVTGAQQIAILAPSADGSVYGMMHSSAPNSTGVSQVMYIMPNAGPCIQPGDSAQQIREPPGTPPPSYSQIDLTEVGVDEGDQQPEGEDERGNNHSANNSEDTDISSVATFNTGPIECSTPIQASDIPSHDDLPQLERLLPLDISRPVAIRPTQRHVSHRHPRLSGPGHTSTPVSNLRPQAAVGHRQPSRHSEGNQGVSTSSVGTQVSPQVRSQSSRPHYPQPGGTTEGNRNSRGFITNDGRPREQDREGRVRDSGVRSDRSGQGQSHTGGQRSRAARSRLSGQDHLGHVSDSAGSGMPPGHRRWGVSQQHEMRPGWGSSAQQDPQSRRTNRQSSLSSVL